MQAKELEVQALTLPGKKIRRVAQVHMGGVEMPTTQAQVHEPHEKNIHAINRCDKVRTRVCPAKTMHQAKDAGHGCLAPDGWGVAVEQW